MLLTFKIQIRISFIHCLFLFRIFYALKERKKSTLKSSHIDFLKDNLVLFCLVWFYSISTIVGYLMPNPFFYIETVLFQTIQFSTSM